MFKLSYSQRKKEVMDELDPRWIRVSSILQMIPTKGEHGKWGFPMQQINPIVLENKANLGTSVHGAISCHIKDEFFVLDQKEEKYLTSYLKWEKRACPHSIETEKRFFYEPMRLTGCVDMIAKLTESGKPRLIDFKCTLAPDHVKWPIQAALYHFLANMNGVYLDDKAIIIQLNPDGDFPKIHEYEITKEISQAALSFYNAYIYLTKS
jgi:hypothetical protein